MKRILTLILAFALMATCLTTSSCNYMIAITEDGTPYVVDAENYKPTVSDNGMQVIER